MKRKKRDIYCCGGKGERRRERIKCRRGGGWGGGQARGNEGGGAFGGRVAWRGLAATVEESPPSFPSSPGPAVCWFVWFGMAKPS